MLRSVVCSIFLVLLVSGFSATTGGVNRQFLQAFSANRTTNNNASTLSFSSANMETDLPVNETLPTRTVENKTLVFMISGDAGWTSFDQGNADKFASQGMPVIGLNARKYFWNKKSPQQITDDALRLIEKYTGIWNTEHIILMGYSFGADVMPFIYNRLPAGVRSRIKSIGLLSPSKSTDFKVHWLEMLSLATLKHKYSVPQEIAKIKDVPVSCFFGKQEVDVSASLLPESCHIIYVNGGHRYEDSFAAIYQNIVK